jgi:hypothetical protein
MNFSEKATRMKVSIIQFITLKPTKRFRREFQRNQTKSSAYLTKLSSKPSLKRLINTTPPETISTPFITKILIPI